MNAARYASKSEWVKAVHLNGGPRTATIESVFLDRLQDGTERLAISFRETDKKLGLNVINTKTLIEMFGTETDDWPGMRITLYPTITEYQGKQVDCIRLRVPEIQMNETRAAHAAQRELGATVQSVTPLPASPLDDGIPF